MWPYLLILLALLADRLSKRWAAAYLNEYGTTQIHPLLMLTETHNEGITLGLFQGIGPLIGWLTIAVVVGLFIYLIRVPREEKLLRAGLAILIGGALGNMIDRLLVGSVLDFLSTPFLPSVFNVADVLIYVGIFLVLLSNFLPSRTQAPSPIADDIQ
jgi:signal peptidase II